MWLVAASILLLGHSAMALPDPSIKTSCDDITYGYCRLDEGNVFVSNRLALYQNLNQSICQIECTVDEECSFFLFERGTCKFVRDPVQYFTTCKDVASVPHVNFEGCYRNLKASSCNSDELGSRKFGSCMYDGKILERMPANDAVMCEKLCQLRFMSRNDDNRCRYFVYDSEIGECQLLGETKTTCQKFLGPPLQRDVCSSGDMADIFDAVNQMATEPPSGAVKASAGLLAPLALTLAIKTWVA